MKLFLSHASEDKPFVRQLAQALRDTHMVWFDEWELKLGDSLLSTINQGLRQCDFAIVVLSKFFLAKKWPKAELDGLFALETAERKVILPIWKGVSEDDVMRFSPILAGRFAIQASEGIERIVTAINRAMEFATIPTARSRSDSGIFRYDRAVKALHAARDEYHRWIALNAAAKESFNQGHDADAKKLAEELESLTPKYVKDWNYGNGIQDFNIVLGRLSLKAGDVESAKKHLLAAGHSSGSPQLGSFGPNMSLAKDLLTKGEKAVVLEYFNLCKAFWKLGRGKLDLWKSDVEEGRIPNFGTSLVY